MSKYGLQGEFVYCLSHQAVMHVDIGGKENIISFFSDSNTNSNSSSLTLTKGTLQ